MTQSAGQAVHDLDDRPGARTNPIDVKHLLHYTMGDEKLAAEVLDLFATQARIYLEQLSQEEEPDQRKILAHTLKGSAQSVGAHALALQAADLETLASADDPDGWAAALRRLNSTFEKIDGSLDGLF